ncbi:glycosyltransferase family 2 protein [bacterium]|nr:glycosyltransferase family 2 protein [bacterium]MBU1994668.1 glycosyltransferase family 2 protein [bacterium]
MVDIIKKILFIAIMVGALVITYFSVNYLQTIYIATTNTFIRFGVILIFVFTLLIIIRYLLLIFFSMIKTIQRSADENFHVSKKDIVSIIVPCFNEEQVILASLKSIMDQTYPNIEIIVIDDGSTDRTYALAQSLIFDDGHRSLKVLSKKNGGKSRALNYAIQRSRGNLICSVDADSKLDKYAIELLVQHFKDPKVAAIAGSVNVINTDSFITKLQALEYIQGLNMVKNGQAFLKLVNIIPGPLGMFRKNAMKEVGYYAHDTFAEDCDITLALIARGYKVDFEPDAISYTEAPENLLDLIKQRYRWTRGILQAIRKNRKYLWTLKKRASLSLVMWYMLFESVFWPFMQIWGDIFMIYLALSTGTSQLLFFWWIMFTVLDIIGAVYCLLITKEDLKLAWYSTIYRLAFITVINIAKIFATIEEWFNIEMGWGKLERKGRVG